MKAERFKAFASLLWTSKNVSFASLLLLLGAWAYWPTLKLVFYVWGSNPDYSHGYLVLPIALWILTKREARPSIARFDARGIWLLAAAAVWRGISGRLYLPELDVWSVPLWLGGVVWFSFGWRCFRWALPSLAFLWFASPLPASIELALGGPLQWIAASMSGAALRLLGYPAITEGTTILLGDHTLDVERACSGMRIFYGIAAMAVAWIALSKPVRTKTMLIVALITPVAIAANVTRIVLTGVLANWLSDEAARAVGHDYAALFMIPLAVAFFAASAAAGHAIERGLLKWSQGDRRPLLRWSAGVLTGFALIGGLASVQQQAIQKSLLASANGYEASGDWPKAIESWRRYSLIASDSPKPYAKMGSLFAKNGAGVEDLKKAAYFYEQSWRRDRTNQELALKAARSAMAAGEHETAARLCRRALDLPGEPETLRAAITTLADALLASVDSSTGAAEALPPLSDQCVAALRRAVELPSPDVRHVASLSHALRFERTAADAEEADKLIARLVETSPDDPSAWLVMHTYLKRSAAQERDPAVASKQTAGARNALSNALNLASQQPGVIAAEVFLAAAADRQPTDPQAARGYLEKAIVALPSDHRPYLLLADWQLNASGTPSIEEAIKTLERGHAAADRTELAIVLPLASLLIEVNKHERAESLLAPVIRVLPNLPSTLRLNIRVATQLIYAGSLEKTRGPAAALTSLEPMFRRAEVRAALANSPRLDAHANLTLARLNRGLGRNDLTLSHCRRAQRIAPDYPGVDRRLAEAALIASDLANADRAYQRLLEADPDDPTALLGRAEVLIRRTERRVDGAASRAERLLRRAGEAGASPADVLALRADLLSALKQNNAAIRLLESALKTMPESPKLWRSLATQQERANDPAQAKAAALRYAELKPKELDPVLLLAQLSLEQDGLGKSLSLVKNFREHADGDALATAAIIEAELLLRQEQTERASDLLDQVADRLPRNLRLLDAQARLAISRLDIDRLLKLEERMKTIEGEQGMLYRSYRAMRLLEQSTAVSGSDFREAARLIESLIDARPRWGEMRFLSGEISRRRNELAAAASEYSTAWSLGKQDVLIADRLIETLMKMERYDEVRDLLKELEELLGQSPKLFDRAAPVLASGWGIRARRLAQRWLEQAPDSPDAHLRLGRILSLLAERPQEPEQSNLLKQRAIAACRKAVQLAPTDVQTWVSAIIVLAGNSTEPQAISQMMDALADEAGIAPLQRNFALAQLYEASGKVSRARVHYARAVRNAEQDRPKSLPQVLIKAAGFYTKTTPLLSEHYAQRALELEPESPDALLAVARAIDQQADWSRLPEASKILSTIQKGKDGKANGRLAQSARLLQASLLGKTGEADDRRQAISLLEASLQTSSEDYRLLAELYEQDSQVLSAFELRSGLATGPNATIEDKAAFLRFWQTKIVDSPDPRINSGFANTAAKIYREIGATRDRYADWLALKLDEALIRSHPDSPPEESVRKLIKQALVLADKNRASEPARVRLARLVLPLVDRDLIQSALSLIEKPPAGLSPEDALAAAANAFMLRNRLPTIGTANRKAYDRYAELSAGDPALKQSVADSYLMAGEYPPAIRLYRELLLASPDRETTTNNLAIALSTSPATAGEASNLLESLLEKNPTDPQLLDSLAVVRLEEGRIDEAVRVLSNLIERDRDNPVFQLHAAVAWRKKGDTTESLRCYGNALASGLENAALSPSDRLAADLLMKEAESAWKAPPLPNAGVRVTSR